MQLIIRLPKRVIRIDLHIQQADYNISSTIRSFIKSSEVHDFPEMHEHIIKFHSCYFSFFSIIVKWASFDGCGGRPSMGDHVEQQP